MSLLTNEKDVETETLMETPEPQTPGFPLASLPDSIRQFVEEGAQNFPAPYELLAIPSLVSLGATIGNSRVVQLKEGYVERPSLYAAVVCESGTMKSPAMHQATSFLRDLQTPSHRTWTSNATVESLARLLQGNPRGILMYQDELSAWVGSMNQYRQGKGADKEFFLSAWGGQSYVMDRVSLENVPIEVNNPFLSVVGAIPPDMLGGLDPAAGQADGFLTRILFGWPKSITPQWSEMTIQPATLQATKELFTQVAALDFDPQVGSLPLPLTPEAQERFIEWHNQHFREMEERATSPFLQGVYSKLKGYCARLSLIHALGTNPATEQVGIDSLEAGISLVEYFKAQAFRVDGFFSIGKHHPVEKLKVAIRRKLSDCHRIKRRDLQRSVCGGNRSSVDFNMALEQMFKAELITNGKEIYWNN
jgi:hypothetical protein